MTRGFGLVVRFTLRDAEAAEAFDALVTKVLEGIRAQEPGTLAHVVHAVAGEPHARLFYELYADRAAFDHHEQQEHTRHFLKEREKYVSDVHVTFLRSQDAAGAWT
ncbi:antibiotic biosynthesis monooxygenase [Streptomyces sp. LP05-1]|uniref:Antibiotic biosynthesis monooxygenase n=1 Tax=Streptomyces pyxinae TaxID=2970734 RepID=A0ABT2CEM6_9ACTN|nr:antibiotic biosynthesis monooxygenase [Streptomyces sp. LP05-1]MCS0635863.1 antibiotic biosynthesis monooxygenase [Streptomyces sp. LP05-1]